MMIKAYTYSGIVIDIPEIITGWLVILKGRFYILNDEGVGHPHISNEVYDFSLRKANKRTIREVR